MSDHSCDRELRDRPDYSVGHSTPEVFDCSCGKRYVIVEDEAEGTSWVLVRDGEDSVLPGGER